MIVFNLSISSKKLMRFPKSASIDEASETTRS